MKVKHHIKTGEFTYVEFEEEYETQEDAIVRSAQLQNFCEEQGLPIREWTKVRKLMLEKGECDPELMAKMNKSQRWFINELKLGIRSLTK